VLLALLFADAGCRAGLLGRGLSTKEPEWFSQFAKESPNAIAGLFRQKAPGVKARFLSFFVVDLSSRPGEL
jgi:hypothetical protein